MQEYILLTNNIQQAMIWRDIFMTDRRPHFAMQSGRPYIRKFHKVLEVVITPAGYDIVAGIDGKLFDDEFEHFLWHLFIVNKPDRTPFFSLLQTFGDLLQETFRN